MDVLADLLDGTRARGGDFNQMMLDPPWSLRIADHATLALFTMLRGTAWLIRDGQVPLRVKPGDVAVVNGPDPYTVADDPTSLPQLLIHAGGRCEPLPGAKVDGGADLGPRTHGRRREGEALILSGTYQLGGEVSARLLNALPPALVVPAEDIPASVMQLIVAEISRDEPGQQVILDRWLDLALITTLRAWFLRPESHPPGWYGAHRDPAVGPALRLLHESPAHPWTISELAQGVGMSRATLARRFYAVVGEPPMAYLTGWRIALAADQLRQTNDTVESIARRVGYANAFALSVAFKRVRGMSPANYRRVTVAPERPAERRA